LPAGMEKQTMEALGKLEPCLRGCQLEWKNRPWRRSASWNHVSAVASWNGKTDHGGARPAGTMSPRWPAGMVGGLYGIVIIKK